MSLTPSFRLPPKLGPQVDPDVADAIGFHDDAITDLQQAIPALKSQIAALSNTTTTPAASSVTTTSTETVTNVTIGGGPVNNQSGVTSYMTAQSDNGALLILADASPVAVTLNNGVTLPWYCFITNQGAGTVTLTPQQNTINGNASETVLQSYFCIVFFDGTNWWSSNIPIVPVSAGPTAHQWISSYNAATGAFTLSQPAYSDLTGTPTLPATIAPVAGDYLTGYNSATGLFSASTTPGISVTITTAALTSLGTQGSMTFVGGILTAQTPAT